VLDFQDGVDKIHIYDGFQNDLGSFGSDSPYQALQVGRDTYITGPTGGRDKPILILKGVDVDLITEADFIGLPISDNNGDLGV
jgi:hypothetical protein